MDFKNTKAIYLQIADCICDSILSGEYPEDGKLPSVREVAADVEVNVNTVARSFEWLKSQDVVVTKRGLGNFVNIGARAAVERLRRREFFEEQLPEMFRTMVTLGISIEEIMENWETSRQSSAIQ